MVKDKTPSLSPNILDSVDRLGTAQRFYWAIERDYRNPNPE